MGLGRPQGPDQYFLYMPNYISRKGHFWKHEIWTTKQKITTPTCEHSTFQRKESGIGYESSVVGAAVQLCRAGGFWGLCLHALPSPW